MAQTTTTKTSPRDRMRARIAQLSTKMLIESYEISARDLEANPSGKNADAHILILSMMDMELIKRDIPCCPQCSAPTATGWHAASLHDDDPATMPLVDAIADAAMNAYADAIVTAASDAADNDNDGKCPVCVYGEPADHTCDAGQQHRHHLLTKDAR